MGQVSGGFEASGLGLGFISTTSWLQKDQRGLRPRQRCHQQIQRSSQLQLGVDGVSPCCFSFPLMAGGVWYGPFFFCWGGGGGESRLLKKELDSQSPIGTDKPAQGEGMALCKIRSIAPAHGPQHSEQGDAVCCGQDSVPVQGLNRLIPDTVYSDPHRT